MGETRPKILFTVDEMLDELGDRKDLPYLEQIISAHGDIPYQGLFERGLPPSRLLSLNARVLGSSYIPGEQQASPKGSC